MFNPSQTEVRNFFFNTFAKAKDSYPLTELEQMAYAIIIAHPQYHNILANKTKYLEFQWTAKMGQTNPFLHLSLHLSIMEQLSINQPLGIKHLYQKLCDKKKDIHQAQHQLMECMTEMLWQAQTTNTAIDSNLYFECINKLLAKD